MLGKSEDKKDAPPTAPTPEEPKAADLVPEPMKELAEEVEDQIA
jgi:hypothetical protein